MIISFALTLSAQENASCRDFTQGSVEILTESDFLPDGRFNSVRLSQGDKIEIYKPFYRGRSYMLIISSELTLPGIVVEVKDISRRVILSSMEISSLHELVYSPEKNENLIIAVEVVKSEEFESTEQGCVSVVIGFQ